MTVATPGSRIFKREPKHSARTRADLESAGRTWHMAYTSSNLAGIQAAVAAGMG